MGPRHAGKRHQAAPLSPPAAPSACMVRWRLSPVPRPPVCSSQLRYLLKSLSSGCTSRHLQPQQHGQRAAAGQAAQLEVPCRQWQAIGAHWAHDQPNNQPGQAARGGTHLPRQKMW